MYIAFHDIGIPIIIYLFTILHVGITLLDITSKVLEYMDTTTIIVHNAEVNLGFPADKIYIFIEVNLEFPADKIYIFSVGVKSTISKSTPHNK